MPDSVSDEVAEIRARVLATLDKLLSERIDREASRDGGPVLDLPTLEHVRRLLRMQVALLSHAEALAHNALVAEEAMAAPARPDSREELLAEIDARAEPRIRARVAEQVEEADWAHILIWADDEELAAGHFTDRDLTSWMNALGHPKAHKGCCKTCGCATTCTARAFHEAVLMTAARIARGEE